MHRGVFLDNVAGFSPQIWRQICILDRSAIDPQAEPRGSALFFTVPRKMELQWPDLWFQNGSTVDTRERRTVPWTCLFWDMTWVSELLFDELCFPNTLKLPP